MDRHFFFLAYLTANKQQRRWLVIIWAVVPLLFALAMFLTLSPYRGISYQYQESYPIVGTENRQLWTLKGSELVTLFNENLPDTAPELSYLHEPTPSDRQIMLTDNGKTWSIVGRRSQHLFLVQTAGNRCVAWQCRGCEALAVSHLRPGHSLK